MVKMPSSEEREPHISSIRAAEDAIESGYVTKTWNTTEEYMALVTELALVLEDAWDAVYRFNKETK